MKKEVRKFLSDAGFKAPAGVVAEEVEPLRVSDAVIDPDVVESFPPAAESVPDTALAEAPVVDAEPVRERAPATVGEAEQWVLMMKERRSRVGWQRAWRLTQADSGYPRVNTYPPGLIDRVMSSAEKLLSSDEFLEAWVRFCLSWPRNWGDGLMFKFIADQAVHLALADVVMGKKGKSKKSGAQS